MQSPVAGALLVCALVASLAPAAAQNLPTRSFPATALRGTLVVEQPPQVRLNGQARRLSPGARIRGPNNLLQLSGTLVGQKLVVHYVQNGEGALQDVWILTPEERLREPWPTKPEQAQTWTFDAAAQAWTR